MLKTRVVKACFERIVHSFAGIRLEIKQQADTSMKVQQQSIYVFANYINFMPI